MNSKYVFLPISLLLIAIFAAGCISGPGEENPNSLIEGRWISDEPVDGAGVSYTVFSNGNYSQENNFTEIWSYSSEKWEYIGMTDDGIDQYEVIYSGNASTCLFYPSSDNYSLMDQNGYIYVRANATSLPGADAITGEWVMTNSKYQMSGNLFFGADGTYDEEWKYTGNTEFLGSSEDGGYLFEMKYPYEDWNFNMTLSSDGSVLTNPDGSTFHKI